MTFGTLFHNCAYSCAPIVAEPVRPLPQLLQEQGWATAAFTGGGYVSPHFGFARGFDTYYTYRRPTEQERTCAPDRFDERLRVAGRLEEGPEGGSMSGVQRHRIPQQRHLPPV